MREPRIVTAQKIKRALQMFKKAREEMYIVTSMHAINGRKSQQVSEKELIKISKLFNLTIQKTNVQEDNWHGSIYLEGLELFSFKFDFDNHQIPSGKYRETKKIYKQSFFEMDGDKQKAFELAKKKSSSNKYTDYFKNYNTLAEIEKFWKRQELRKETDGLMIRYLDYKQKWECQEWSEREGNYKSPYTFKQWHEEMRARKVAS